MNQEAIDKGREAFESVHDTSQTSWLAERNYYSDSNVQHEFKKFMDAYELGYNAGLEDGSILSPS